MAINKTSTVEMQQELREKRKKKILILKELSIFPEDGSKYTNTNNELGLTLKFANGKHFLWKQWLAYPGSENIA